MIKDFGVVTISDEGIVASMFTFNGVNVHQAKELVIDECIKRLQEQKIKFGDIINGH